MGITPCRELRRWYVDHAGYPRSRPPISGPHVTEEEARLSAQSALDAGLQPIVSCQPDASASPKCEDCGASNARLLCRWPAWLCGDCAARRKADALASQEGGQPIAEVPNATPAPNPSPTPPSPDADLVQCQVSGGVASYRFPRGAVTTQFEFIGVRPGVSGVGELIQITDLAATIRDSFLSHNSFHGYARLFVLEPGQVRPIDVVSTVGTAWTSIQFDPDEWMTNWAMMHDLGSSEISDKAFENLYEISRPEGEEIREGIQLGTLSVREATR